MMMLDDGASREPKCHLEQREVTNQECSEAEIEGAIQVIVYKGPLSSHDVHCIDGRITSEAREPSEANTWLTNLLYSVYSVP